MDKFEKEIKEAVAHYEVPYSDAAWKSLSKRMGPEKGLMTKWILGASAALIIISGLVWVNLSPNNQANDYLANANEPQQETPPVSAPEPTKVNQPSVTEKTAIVTNDVVENDVETPTQVTNSEHQNVPEVNANQSNQNETNANRKIESIDALKNTIHSPNLQTPEAEADLVFEEEETISYADFDLKVVADQNAVCEGKSIAFTPSIPKIKAIYQWDLGDGNIIDANFIDHTYTKPGTYTVKLTLLDPKTKAVVKTAPLKDVVVNPTPTNVIEYEMKRQIIPTVYFSQNINDDEQIIWEIVGHHRSSEANFSYEFKKKGEYLVKSTVLSSTGCSNTQTETIKIEEDYNLLAPNTFTPNGDGDNETFIPKALLITDSPFEMMIYSKTGDLIYQTNDANSPWDGLYTKDLNPAPSGTYIWVVKMTNTSGEPETYNGTILLMRP